MHAHNMSRSPLRARRRALGDISNSKSFAGKDTQQQTSKKANLSQVAKCGTETKLQIPARSVKEAPVRAFCRHLGFRETNDSCVVPQEVEFSYGKMAGELQEPLDQGLDLSFLGNKAALSSAYLDKSDGPLDDWTLQEPGTYTLVGHRRLWFRSSSALTSFFALLPQCKVRCWKASRLTTTTVAACLVMT